METGLLEAKLGYKFRDPELLTEALTHSIDYSNNTQTITVSKHTCDRLKLIGDCVIKLITCQYAISVSKPDEKLGTITKIKDDMCNRFRQHQVGQQLNLEHHVVVTEELKSTPSFNISNHYETFVKSIMGAIFIDAGGSDKKGFKCTWSAFLKLWSHVIATYPPSKLLVQCFPEPKFSSSTFLVERFKDLKDLKFKDLTQLEKNMGFQFLKRPYLLEQAMTHDSIEEFGKDDFAHYQTLEFLGDSVIELIIMEYLYCKYDSADPLGQMLFFNRETGQKLYNSKFQVKVAKKLQLEQYVIKAPYIVLSTFDDFVESIIGAVYIHCGAVAMKKTSKIVLHLWGLEPLLDIVTPGSENSIETAPAPSSLIPQPPRKIPEEPDVLTEIQSKLNYKFRDPRIITSVLELECESSTTTSTYPSYFRNLQELGRRTVELLIVEYVIGVSAPDPKLNLSAKEKRAMERLRVLLSSKEVVNEIGKTLELHQRVTLLKHESAQDYVFAIFGAVYIDCGSNHSIVKIMFKKLWSSYIQTGQKQISECFVNTSEEQKKFRGGLQRVIADKMWTKLYTKLGHKFTLKNLAEQALTDEKSQGFAKSVYNACPSGNPFALQMLGSAAIKLFIAFRSFHNTAACPENFEGVIERFEASLFKVLENNLINLESYYVRQYKYPFPPKKNPRYPYEALLGAVYVDCGGGNKACETLEAVIIKQDPSLVKVSRGKAIVPGVPGVPANTLVFSPSQSPMRVNPMATGLFSPPPGMVVLPQPGFFPPPVPMNVPSQNSPFPMFPPLQEFPGACTFGPPIPMYSQTPPFSIPQGFSGRSGSPGIIGSRAPPIFRPPIVYTPPPDSNNVVRPPSVASSKSSKQNNGSKSNSSSPGISRASTPKSIQAQLNNSLNSKCAANFGVSPVQKIPTPPKTHQNGFAFGKPFTAAPEKSPKKQKQTKSYASALTNGKTTPPNELVAAVVQAQSEINALKAKLLAKPEAKGKILKPFHKIDGNAQEPKPPPKPDGKAEAQKPAPKPEAKVDKPKMPPPPSDNASDEGSVGSKKKRGKRGGKKKKGASPPNQTATPPALSKQAVTAAAATPPKPAPVAPPPDASVKRPVQIIQKPVTPKSQTTNCTTPHHAERPGPSHSASLRINKVHGYPNAKYRNPEPDSSDERDDKDEKQPEESTLTSVLTVVKWTTVALGVFFLINKYVNRK